MRIYSINSYNHNFNTTKFQKIKRQDTPVEQPSFKGLKGLLWGGGLGAGATAAGVAALLGPVGWTVFGAYIALNGAVGAAAGHLAEKSLKDK